MARRLILIALLALIAPVGCATRGRLAPARPEPMNPGLPPISAADVIDRLNRNAQPVVSLEATSNITVKSGGQTNGVDGRLAMQRPRDFTFQVKSVRGVEADIGSNDQRFWLWTKGSKDKAVYYCDYDNSGAAPIALGLQPDWIVEAMGLRVISEDEARTMTLTRGSGPNFQGTYILSQRLRGADGQSYAKSTIISESTNRVMERQLHLIQGPQSTLVARATVSEYKPYPVEGTDEEGNPRRVEIPSKFTLSWIKPDRMEMAVTIDHLNINPKIDPQRFVERPYPGYARIPLNDPSAVAADSTSIRETRPAPPTGTGIQLQTPVPVSNGETSRKPGPIPLGPDLAGAVAPGGEVIGPRIPTAPEPEGMRQGSFATARGPILGIER